MGSDNSIFEEAELESEYFEQEFSLEEALAEAFTPEEIEGFYYDKRKKIPFSQLSKSQKGVPLESIIRRYCNSTRFKYNISFKDLAKNKNQKK